MAPRQPVALFVDARGVYPRLLGAERCWGKARDARDYFGPAPVVAHRRKYSKGAEKVSNTVGVIWDKRCQKWAARRGGKWVGRFSREEDAELAVSG